MIHGLAIAAAVATYLLILIGGLVHGTGSSLACPDWPTCYGTMMPKMEGGVLVEHSHRLAAGTVMILTLVLTIAMFASKQPLHRRLRPFGGAGDEPGRWCRRCWAASPCCCGCRRRCRRCTPASSLLFFLTMLYLAVRSRPAARRDRHARAGAALPDRAVWLALVSAVAVYFQMVLGGLVRHSGAALACTDLPLCRGAVWPDAHPTVLIHVLHRMNALVVAALVLASSIVDVSPGARRAPGCARSRVLAPVLVVVQIALGVLRHRQTSSICAPSSRTSRSRPRCSRPRSAWCCSARRADADRACRRCARASLVDLVRLTKPRITGAGRRDLRGRPLAGAGRHGALAGGDDADRHGADRRRRRTRSTCSWSATRTA